MGIPGSPMDTEIHGYSNSHIWAIPQTLDTTGAVLRSGQESFLKPAEAKRSHWRPLQASEWMFFLKKAKARRDFFC